MDSFSTHDCQPVSLVAQGDKDELKFLVCFKSSLSRKQLTLLTIKLTKPVSCTQTKKEHTNPISLAGVTAIFFTKAGCIYTDNRAQFELFDDNQLKIAKVFRNSS